MLGASAEASASWLVGSFAALALGHLRRTPPGEPVSSIAGQLVQRALAVAQSARAAIGGDPAASATLNFQLGLPVPAVASGAIDGTGRRASAPS